MIQRNRGERPRWWSLDYWVNPDAQNRVSVENRPSAGTRDNIVGLFKPRRDRGHLDLATDWASDKTAQALTSDFKEGAGDFDVAFVVDEPDSGVVRAIVESGHYDLLSLDGADDLFHDDVVFRTSTTMRPLVLEAGSLSSEKVTPSCKVITIESQTILACSADLPDWNAYQVGVLDEHFRELAWGGSRLCRSRNRTWTASSITRSMPAPRVVTAVASRPRFFPGMFHNVMDTVQPTGCRRTPPMKSGRLAVPFGE